MRGTLALVLAGGEGRRLSPLTRERSKPAVYFGGRYRLIDFVLSNLVNSRMLRIKVLTQYRATSLVRHLARAWSVAPGVLDQYIDPVPAAIEGLSMKFSYASMDNCAICIEPWIKTARSWISSSRHGGTGKPPPASFAGFSSSRAKRPGG